MRICHSHKRTKGRRGLSWTEEEIERQLRQVIDIFDLDHFPTAKELKDYTGTANLYCAINKNGGVKRWADRLGAAVRTYRPSSPQAFEERAMRSIKEETGFDCVRTSDRCPFDLYVNGQIKIGIKPVLYWPGRTAKTWIFRFDKTQPVCDIYILYCILSKTEIAKTLVIPSCVLSGKEIISMGLMGIYDCYKNRWDIIAKYNEFFRTMKMEMALKGGSADNMKEFTGRAADILTYLLGVQREMPDTVWDLKEHREKRSLTANGLLWTCLQQIAEAVGSDKWSVYLQMLKRYGRFDYVIVKPKAVEAMKRQWREIEEVGEIEVNGQKAVQMLCYYGSSSYDGREFSRLLDGVMSEMKEMGLQLPPEKKVRELLDAWDARE